MKNLKQTFQKLYQSSQLKFKEISNKIFQEKDEKVLHDLLDLETESPSDMRIKTKIAEILYRQGLAEEAIEKFQHIANHFEKEQFFLKAIGALKRILQIKPDLTPINLKLAALYLKLEMKAEASNQYRIAINAYLNSQNSEEALMLAKKLVEIDPSIENRTKLSEIYQSHGMSKEAVEQYEVLAKNFREKKDYDKLLHCYELILPHKPNNRAILKDVCILHLRHKRPDRALQLMEEYRVLDDVNFKDLIEKSKLMIDALKRHKTKKA